MSLPDFDRELTLADCARGLPLDRIAAALEMALGVPLGIEDLDGRIVAGHAVPAGEAIALTLEIEPLGWLRVPAGHAAQGAAGASLLQQLLQQRAQVVRAGDLHASAMSADYEQLRVRNEALQRSEARYRELAASLEEKVKEQVALLDERQRQLYLAERLASVGQLAAGVAHEINNPIGFIRSNLETGRRYLPKLRELKVSLRDHAPAGAAWQRLDLDFVVDDLEELLGDCIAGAERIARIVRDLKGFSNVDRPEAEDVDLNEQLAAAVAVLAGQKPDGVRIVQHYASGLPRLMCLPGHLGQVFVSLLTNALQAVQDRPDPTIEVRTGRDDTHFLIEIADNGCGIPAELMPRVFEPFFTTRGVGKGTGLGLTIARDIVGAHDGTLDLSSQAGEGTRARVRLPIQ
ncbi:MAG TPA: ATP-binding protein [Albitalea sp.]